MNISNFIFHSLNIDRAACRISLQLQRISHLSKTHRSSDPFALHSRRFLSNMPGPMANGSSGEIHSHIDRMDEPRRIPNRLILCFDGTGNSFLGNTQDTNIVKLYDKFDRSAPHQMHYYQRELSSHRDNPIKTQRLQIDFVFSQPALVPTLPTDPRLTQGGLGKSSAQYLK